MGTTEGSELLPHSLCGSAALTPHSGLYPPALLSPGSGGQFAQLGHRPFLACLVEPGLGRLLLRSWTRLWQDAPCASSPCVFTRPEQLLAPGTFCCC